MVQAFGNRILGGIGAPGGGMSEAFGTGAGLALDRRTALRAMDEQAQIMRLRDVQAGYVAEDREEAKRRAAAAAAAGASARARSAALRETQMRIFGGAPAGLPAGLTLPAAGGAAPGQSRFPSQPPPGAAAAAPAPARPRATSPTLTFGGAGAPVATSSSSSGSEPGAITNIEFVQGTTGGPTTMLGAQGFERRTGLPVDIDAYLGRRGVGGPMSYDQIVEAARAGQMPTYDTLIASAEAGLLSGQQAADVNSMIELGVVPGAAEQQQTNMPGVTETTLGAPYNVRAGGVSDYFAGLGGRTTGQQAAIAAERARLAGGTAPVTDVATPAAPVPPEVAVTLPGGERVMLSTGMEAPPAQQEQLSFGPRLGAAPQTQEDIMVDLFIEQIGIDPNAPAPAAPPRMGQPGAPNKAITGLLTKREQMVEWTQALLDAEQYGDAEAAQAEIMNIDAKLEAAVGRLALNEAIMSNAPQRLSAVWSDNTGQQYEFLPSVGGGLDVYVNGELLDENLSMDLIERQTLMMTDQAFAGRQAELQAIREEQDVRNMSAAGANVYEAEQKAAMELRNAYAVGMTELDLLAIKRDLGLGDRDQLDFQKDENTGIILVFRNGEPAAQYAPVIAKGPTGEDITRFELMPE